MWGSKEETLSRACKQIEKNVYELRNAMNNLGGKNDKVARRKIRHLRNVVKKIIKKSNWAAKINEANANEQESEGGHSNQSNINGESNELCKLRLRYKELTALYERTDNAVRITERSIKGNTHEDNDEGDDDDFNVTDRKSEDRINDRNRHMFGNKKHHYNNNDNDDDNDHDQDEDSDKYISDERQALLQEQVEPQADMSKFAKVKEVRQQRLENIREIEKDVIDLKTTYEEFHSLVHQQQSGIDTIQSNVENAQVLVDSGTEELQAASNYQKNSKKVACILFLVLICVLVTIAVVVFALLQKNKIK